MPRETYMDRDKRDPEKARNKSKAKLLGILTSFCLQDFYCRKWLLLAILSAVIAILVSPSFIVENPRYRLGDIADRNVKAKHDLLIEDEEATAKKREEAMRLSPIVYDFNETLTRDLLDKLEASFKAMREPQGSPESETLPAAPGRQPLKRIDRPSGRYVTDPKRSSCPQLMLTGSRERKRISKGFLAARSKVTSSSALWISSLAWKFRKRSKIS